LEPVHRSAQTVGRRHSEQREPPSRSRCTRVA